MRVKLWLLLLGVFLLSAGTAVSAANGSSPSPLLTPPSPFIFAYQDEAVIRWVDTSRVETFTDRDGQRVVSVWVKCVFDGADRDKITKNLFASDQTPPGMERLAYFTEHYWFILSDAGYPEEKLPARIIVERLYYDDSGSGKAIDFDTYLYKGLNHMRQLYQSLSANDHLILGLAASAEPRLSQTTGILKPQTLRFKGTVRYIDLEGGFWGIVSDDGKHYDPSNLAQEYQQEGLRVAVEAVVLNRVGIHMWGTIIEIKAITKLGGQQ